MLKSKEIIKRNLTWDRLDLAFELFYLDLINKNKKLAEKVYWENTKIQLEFKNCEIKSDNYIKLDYKFYQERGIEEWILDSIVTKFIEHSNDTYIAFLWPAGKAFKDEVNSIFTNIVYKKDIKLTPTGLFNLLYELYKPREWLGNKANKYKGTQEKLIECFPDFGEFTIIVFQSDSLQDVINTKAKVRLICDIKNSSIHTTDNREESLRISRLILNESGRHFLNHSNLHKFEFFSDEIKFIKKFILENNLNPKDIVLDSNMTLALYGIRDFNNINYISLNDEQLKYFNKNKEDLIYNPLYHFYYSDIKFISFKKIYNVKTNRTEKKDKGDIEQMNSLINNTPADYKSSRLNQRIMYMKIKFKFKIIDFISNISRKIGLHKIFKVVYHKIKG